LGSLYKDGVKILVLLFFYIEINIGGWITPLLCGWLAVKYGYGMDSVWQE
jgi:POT family proton-dependent oligopeptide transporter